MSDKATLIKQLKIKTAVVKRLFKEITLYTDEEKDLKVKRNGAIAKGAQEDGWEVKNLHRMQEESKTMITDTTTRLKDAVLGLRELVVRGEKEPDVAETQEYIKAMEALEEVSV